MRWTVRVLPILTVNMDPKVYIKYADELFRTIEDKLEEFEEESDYDRTPDKLEATIEPPG